jgi:hypothetical protein
LLDTATLGLFFILTGHLPEGIAKSDGLFLHFKIPIGDDRHSALGDARATARLLNAFLQMARGPEHTANVNARPSETLGR